MKALAYDEDYLPWANRVMGDMLDYAVNTLNYTLKKFYTMFLVSGIAKQFEIGNPMYIVGKNGCEVAKEVISKCGLAEPTEKDVMYLDKSPEYWTGYCLSYYQCVSNMTFKEINNIISVDEICTMYYPYHEADIMKFVEVVEEKRQKSYNEKSLARLRKYASMTQKQLAESAGVPIRQIQQFEQGERDIHKTQIDTVMRLANTLKCRPEDLLD